MSNIGSHAAEQYRLEGYTILERALDDETLASVRDECAIMMRRMDEEMDRLGVDSIGSTRRGLQYFPGNCSYEQPGVRKFALSELMARVCTALIGPDSYLFWEQFAVKFGEISARLADNKCQHVVTSGAGAVVLGDLGCMLNIEGRLRRRGDATRVLHVAEVLAGE